LLRCATISAARSDATVAGLSDKCPHFWENSMTQRVKTVIRKVTDHGENKHGLFDI
jgi:hypothetical protein